MEKTTPRNMSLFTLNRSSLQLRILDAKNRFHLSTVNFSSAAPRPDREASQLTLISNCGF